MDHVMTNVYCCFKLHVKLELYKETFSLHNLFCCFHFLLQQVMNDLGVFVCFLAENA